MTWIQAQSKVDEIIAQSYAELKDVGVQLRLLPPLLHSIAPFITSPFSPRIYANRSFIENLPDDVLTGALAHELYHVRQFRKMTTLLKLSVPTGTVFLLWK